MNRLIEGVQLKPLITHSDERGYFREALRITDDIISSQSFAQWSWSMMYQGVIKAWHIHNFQYDFFLCPFGIIKVALYDNRKKSDTYKLLNEFMMGDNYDPFILKIPPGVAHGLKVVQGPAHLFYITSRVYDPKDEGRIPYDDKGIGYDWLKGPEIK